MIHYDLQGANAPNLSDSDNNSIPDYVERVAEFAELSRKTLLDDLGFLSEPSDDDGIYDIYLLNQSAWGWNVVDSDYQGASYVKLDNDYEGLNFFSDYCQSSLKKMQISVAHEYFHAIQRAYKPNASENSDFLMELSSMWFEDIMVPDCNDYLSFVDALSYSLFNNPFQKFDGSDLSANQSEANFGYSMALFGHYLTNIVDANVLINETTIIKKIWEYFSLGLSPTESVIRTIEDDFGKSFPNVWVDFISKNFFCGEYDFFNENFYYHDDQKLINPISVSTSNFILPDNNLSLSQMTNELSANVVSLGILGELVFNSSISDINNLNISFCRLGYSNMISDDLNQNQLLLNNGDKIIYVFSAGENSVGFNIDIETSPRPSNNVEIVKLYPNPIKINNNLNIEIKNEFSSDIDFIFYDLNGRLLMNRKIIFNNYQSSEIITLNLNEFINSSGSYKIIIKDKNTLIHSEKITFIK